MVEIKKIKPPLPYKKMVSVLHDAFRERTEVGLNYLCASFNDDDLMNHISKNALVFGAFQNETLVGMTVLNSIRSRFGMKFATMEYVAIKNDFKRQGIGSALFKARLKEAKEIGIDFVLSDTAISALSAINYHKKVGFKIYGYSHYPGRTYKSVNFIYPITLKGKLLASFAGRVLLGMFFCKNYDSTTS